MRLRTLPLALASTLTGAFLAVEYVSLDIPVLILTVLTTIFLQVNSNLANDYGDFSHGTDNNERIGPERALQSGILQPAEMKRAIYLFSALSFISGVSLLCIAPLEIITKAILLLMGLAAIYASIKYTAGKNPYGYRGLGDVSVMAFFGILGVVGAFVCQTGAFDWTILLPALSIGAFSTGVLNVNNTRDMQADQRSGKITLAVKLGAENARRYHVVLLLLGMLFFLLYAFLHFQWWMQWTFVLAFPLFIRNAVKVYTTKEDALLDPFLKQLAISTFFFAVLIGVGMLS